MGLKVQVRNSNGGIEIYQGVERVLFDPEDFRIVTSTGNGATRVTLLPTRRIVQADISDETTAEGGDNA